MTHVTRANVPSSDPWQKVSTYCEHEVTVELMIQINPWTISVQNGFTGGKKKHLLTRATKTNASILHPQLDRNRLLTTITLQCSFCVFYVWESTVADKGKQAARTQGWHEEKWAVGLTRGKEATTFSRWDDVLKRRALCVGEKFYPVLRFFVSRF